MTSQETLAQLVERVLPTKFDSLRDADRKTGVPYGTWQNITLRGTIPTLDTLEKVAAALDIPELDVINAARVSKSEREAAKAAEIAADLDQGIDARQRRQRDNRPSNGRSARNDRAS